LILETTMQTSDYWTTGSTLPSAVSNVALLDDDPSVAARGVDEETYASGPLLSRKCYWICEEGLPLESGHYLSPILVAYESWGTLNPAGDNAILVCHALTGDSHAAGKYDPADTRLGWWDPLIGPGRAFDTDRYFVVCANVLGGCQGTTGPSNLDPFTRRPYGSAFPQVTVRDIVRLQHGLLEHLGVHRLAAVAGGSLGGMQVLEWLVTFPEFVEAAIPIGASLAHTAQGIAFNLVGREAIMNDPDWQGGNYYGTGRTPDRGLSIARMLGIITYQSDESMTHKFARRSTSEYARPDLHTNERDLFQVESYLRYQGDSLCKRFDANSYLVLSRAMDLHDVGRDRGGVQAALSKVDPSTRTLVIGISSDILFPTHLQREIVDRLHSANRHAEYHEITSPWGHDAFLIEYDQLTTAITRFLSNNR
jgi:homoserine O-acetyltransferase/O-succinyltransferase